MSLQPAAFFFKIGINNWQSLNRHSQPPCSLLPVPCSLLI
ncbi:hypothetical protein FDUTEX481_08382 [Tolypothrix sp. PCC 7601]|nr:hypothetical protein FDUTEX481_08382 [Tolypothrix sp. PCC 7601]